MAEATARSSAEGIKIDVALTRSEADGNGPVHIRIEPNWVNAEDGDAVDRLVEIMLVIGD